MNEQLAIAFAFLGATRLTVKVLLISCCVLSAVRKHTMQWRSGCPMNRLVACKILLNILVPCVMEEYKNGM